jgi:hypothetical protein
MFLELTVIRKENERTGLTTLTKSLINTDKVVIFYPKYEGVRIETKNEIFDVEESYEFIKAALEFKMINTTGINK